MTLGLEPLTIVEIDVPFCTRVFGVGVCTAALSAAVPNKCHNSRATCAVPAVYNPGVLTLRFARNQSGLPKGMTVYPALSAVSERPGRINLSGVDPASTALGQRARVTVSLQDFTDNDTLTDKYRAERVSGAAQFGGAGYAPEERGTFWGKLLARQPYLLGAALRVKRGYVGQSLGAMATAHYVISETPTINAAGRVEITAKDILDLAENSKAKAPAPSVGKLRGNIGGGASTLTLDPVGVGAQYAAAGRVCVGREVMTYTRSGDTLTLTARGADGTTAEPHEAGDLVQACARYENQQLSDVARDLLVTYAGVPAGFIDLTAWNAEENAWLSIPVTATITRPTGVSRLIGELCQLGVMIWWDEVGQQIRFRVSRPLAPGEAYVPVSDAANIIEGTPEIESAEDQRISTVEFWHGMIDPTDDATNARNFSKLVIATVAENLYGQASIKTIYTRWMGLSGNDAAASVITERLLARYQVTPKKLSFAVDVKDKDAVALATLITVTSYLLTDATGASVPTPMQVNGVTPRDGRIAVECESFTIDGRFGFYTQEPLLDYDTATATEKAEGAFYTDDTIGTFPDGTGPYVYF